MLPDPVILASTILIVDDEEFLLEYVRIVLLRCGFTVLTAKTGAEAWHLILHRRNEIRLVLTDIVMPGSFGGFELADRVHRREPDLTVLFIPPPTSFLNDCYCASLSVPHSSSRSYVSIWKLAASRHRVFSFASRFKSSTRHVRAEHRS
jgi:hypothetical protein